MQIIWKLMTQGFEFELHQEAETLTDIVTLAQELKKYGEFLPVPRYTARDKGEFTPFVGVVEKTEPTKTKNGKDMFIAHVRPIVAEGEEQKELTSVMYLPPQATFRVDDKVKITRSDKGWLEINHAGTEAPF